jgi:hypothetical protein
MLAASRRLLEASEDDLLEIFASCRPVKTPSPTSASSGTVSRIINRLAMVISKSQVDELDGRPTLACGEEVTGARTPLTSV